MLICDDRYFYFAKISIKRIIKFYPNSRIFIYDWGLSPKHQRILNTYSNVIIIDWAKNIDWNNGYKDIKYNNEVYIRKPTRDYTWNQKPKCMLNCSKRIKENLIFIDADAFLIKNIDEVFESEFDIGVTAIINENYFQKAKAVGIDNRINSGIIFFLTDSQKINLFIKEWIKTLNETYSYLAEQTSLIKTVEKANQDIFNMYYNEGTLMVSGTRIKIKILPYYIYNYHEAELLYDYSRAKIIHILNRGVEKLPQIILEFKLYHFFLKVLKILPNSLNKKIFKNLKLNYISEFLVKKKKIRVIKNYIKRSIEILTSKQKEIIKYFINWIFLKKLTNN